MSDQAPLIARTQTQSRCGWPIPICTAPTQVTHRVATAAVTLARVAALSNTSKVLARGKGRRGWGGADAPVAGAGNLRTQEQCTAAELE